eukprot:TRINITY_DN39744_c0_g1_i1.p2 TRINITY_DN39744_c0_g1~~TRINITY_DN39744_c0_g1_i1.p2  ORF type:complete len:121 (+),score=17.40 TRINITY_DN39744_c0_g1_i1:94-456(+)
MLSGSGWVKAGWRRKHAPSDGGRGESGASRKKLVGQDGLDNVVDRLPQEHGSVKPVECLTLDDVMVRLDRAERARLAKRTRRVERAKEMRQMLKQIKEETNGSIHDDSRLCKQLLSILSL